MCFSITKDKWPKEKTFYTNDTITTQVPLQRPNWPWGYVHVGNVLRNKVHLFFPWVQQFLLAPQKGEIRLEFVRKFNGTPFIMKSQYNNVIQPGQISYSKMHGVKSRYNGLPLQQIFLSPLSLMLVLYQYQNGLNVTNEGTWTWIS